MSAHNSSKRRGKTSNNNCIICLNSFKRVGKEEESYTLQIYSRFIQVIKRYLQIDIGTDGGGGGDQFFKRICSEKDLVHAFCNVCFKTVAQVCDLYHELCEVRVRLGSKLGELGELVEKGVNNNIEDNKRAGISAVLGDADRRQLIASKCLQKFKEAGPQVTINPVTTCGGNRVQNDDPSPNIKVEMEVAAEPSDEEASMEWDADQDYQPHFEDGSESEYDQRNGVETQDDIKHEYITSSVGLQESSKASKIQSSSTKRAKNSDTIRLPRRKIKKTRMSAPKRKRTRRILESEDDGPNGEIFNCSHCSQVFTSIYHLKTHLDDLESKTEEPPSQCCFCWKSFALEQSQALHFKMKHSNSSFPCHESTCRLSFQKLEELNCHLLTHSTSTSESLHFCSKCNWGFLSAPLLTLHELSHTPKTQARYTCSRCDKRFDKILSYQDHYNSKHGDKVEFHQCSKCDSSFASTNYLKKHLKTHNECPKTETKEPRLHVDVAEVDKDNPLRCPECSKVFSDTSRLSLHRWYHTSRSCCNEKFHQFEHYSKHMRQIHGEERVINCYLCQIPLRSRSSLIKHLRIMHGSQAKDHLCSFCGKGYKDKLYLNEHMKRFHSEEIPMEAKHSCPHCEQRFHRNLMLRRHLRECVKNPDRNPADNEPPVIMKQICSGRVNTCATCGKVIKNGTVGMRRHLKTHIPKEKRRKFKCRVCAAVLVSNASLWSHLRRIHQAKDELCQDCGAMYFSTDGGRHRCPDRKINHHIIKQQNDVAEAEAGETRVWTMREGRNYHLEILPGKEENSE